MVQRLQSQRQLCHSKTKDGSSGSRLAAGSVVQWVQQNQIILHPYPASTCQLNFNSSREKQLFAV